MGFFDSISDMLEAALPWSTSEAEAPKDEDEEKVGASILCVLRVVDRYIGPENVNWEIGIGIRTLGSRAMGCGGGHWDCGIRGGVQAYVLLHLRPREQEH